MQWLHGGQQATQTFAANVAPQESSPDRLADARLKALLDPLPVQLTIASGASGAGQGREVWRAVVWGMLLLLGVECALAAWVSRER